MSLFHVWCPVAIHQAAIKGVPLLKSHSCSGCHARGGSTFRATGQHLANFPSGLHPCHDQGQLASP